MLAKKTHSKHSSNVAQLLTGKFSLDKLPIISTLFNGIGFLFTWTWAIVIATASWIHR